MSSGRGRHVPTWSVYPVSSWRVRSFSGTVAWQVNTHIQTCIWYSSFRALLLQSNIDVCAHVDLWHTAQPVTGQRLAAVPAVQMHNVLLQLLHSSLTSCCSSKDDCSTAAGGADFADAMCHVILHVSLHVCQPRRLMTSCEASSSCCRHITGCRTAFNDTLRAC
jgi:hypothetical protein